MPTTQADIDRLLAAAPGAKPEYIENSGWLDDRDEDEIDAIEQEYREKYVAKLTELTTLLGAPKWTRSQDRDWFARWYPEALDAAAWERGEKIVALSVEHHDRETPVALALQCLTPSELAALSE